MKLSKSFSIFLIVHFIIWSILPMLLRQNLPMDSAEALVWGFIGEWGTNKHPPLSGFFASMAYAVIKSPSVLYILSQLFVIGAMIYVYKLARLFFSEPKALASAMILEGVAYYNLVTPEYNVNIISLMLWPAASYYFYLSMRQNKFSSWILFGVFAGLNILNKYVSGVLLLCLGLYILLTKQGRNTLKSWKLYVAAIVAFAVITPHIIWLYNHDWFVLDYFLSRSGEGKTLPCGLAHIIYPLKFLGAQLMTSILALIIFFTARHSGQKQTSEVSASDRVFIFYAGVLPMLLMAGISFVFGIKLKSMWGSPVLYMLGILLFTRFPFAVEKNFAQIVKLCYGAMAVFAIVFVLQVMFTTSAKFKLNADNFVQTVGKGKYDYVGGSVWLASTVGVYDINHPAVLYFMEEGQNPWIDMAEVRKKGILVVDEDLASYQAYQKKFARLSAPQIYDLTVKTPFGKVKQHKLYYGTIAGE